MALGSIYVAAILGSFEQPEGEERQENLKLAGSLGQRGDWEQQFQAHLEDLEGTPADHGFPRYLSLNASDLQQSHTSWLICSFNVLRQPQIHLLQRLLHRLLILHPAMLIYHRFNPILQIPLILTNSFASKLLCGNLITILDPENLGKIPTLPVQSGGRLSAGTKAL